MTLERSRGEKTAMLGPAQCSVDRTEDDRAAEERDLPMQGGKQCGMVSKIR
jgi:hypothetical protein